MLTRWRKRRRCPHSRLRGIYGDEINLAGARLDCLDCGRLLDGPVRLADSRRGEWLTSQPPADHGDGSGAGGREGGEGA